MNSKQLLVVVSVAAIAGCLGGVLAVSFLAPQSVLAQGDPSQNVITAGMFRVMDSDGRIRASLGVGPTGAAYLAINDDQAQLRTGLAVYQGNPSLVFYHKDADTRDGFPHPLDEGAGVWLYDVENKPRGVLGTLPIKRDGSTDTGPTGLVLMDQQGRVVWTTP
jgi:hypothetical protein